MSDETQVPDVPHFVEVCCQTGAVTYVPLTPEQLAFKKALDEKHNSDKAKEEEEKKAIKEAVANSKDEAVKRMAKMLGIV